MGVKPYAVSKPMNQPLFPAPQKIIHRRADVPGRRPVPRKTEGQCIGLFGKRNHPLLLLGKRGPGKGQGNVAGIPPIFKPEIKNGKPRGGKRPLGVPGKSMDSK